MKEGLAALRERRPTNFLATPPQPAAGSGAGEPAGD
jgi:hypothetical protein